jgi:hypothetical protein
MAEGQERFLPKFLRDAALTIVGGLVIEPTLHHLHFDVGPYLRQIWFAIFAFITLDALWRSTMVKKWAYGTHHRLNQRNKRMSYLIVSITGAICFSLYWLIITRAITETAPLGQTPEQTPTNTSKKYGSTPVAGPSAPTSEPIQNARATSQEPKPSPAEVPHVNTARPHSSPTADEIADALAKKIPPSGQGVPERWKIPGNRFSEMPTDDLCNQAENLSKRMKQDREDTDNTIMRIDSDYQEFVKSNPNANLELQKEIRDTHIDLARGEYKSRYVFHYEPDAELVRAALALRAPAGSLSDLSTYGYATLSKNAGALDAVADDLKSLANSVRGDSAKD